MVIKIPIEFTPGFVTNIHMQNKNVTVVGGTGFLGHYVVKLLAERGWQVRVIARDVEHTLELKTAGDVGQVTFASGDITRIETLKGKLHNSYAVINLVGILYERGRQTFDDVHARGAGKLAELAKLSGAERFVHVSSIGADSGGRSQYARTKAIGENAVKAAFPQATILRPSVIFGTEDMFFNKFAAMACLMPFLPLIGGGLTRFAPVYVMDVAQAVVAALELPVQGKAFELGGPKSYTLREILEFIGRTTGRQRRLLNISFPVAKFLSNFTGMLPDPPLTRDQVIQLKTDNIPSGTAKKLVDLGIAGQSVENVVPGYLARFARKIA